MGHARTTRLAPDARRDQLIEKGLELLGQHAYDQMSITELAQAAGISKGLLYHYFPTKSDFVVAVLRRAREQLDEQMTLDDAALEPSERLDASLDAFLTYIEQHAAGYQAIVRARSGDDAAIREELADARRQRVSQLIDVAAAWTGQDRAGVDTPLLDTALSGWLSFSDEVTVRWVTEHELERSEVRHLLRQALLATFASALEIGAEASVPNP